MLIRLAPASDNTSSWEPVLTRSVTAFTEGFGQEFPRSFKIIQELQ